MRKHSNDRLQGTLEMLVVKTLASLVQSTLEPPAP